MAIPPATPKNVPPVPPMPVKPDSIFTYNDLLKQYAGLAMQTLLSNELQRYDNHDVREITNKAYILAKAMALAYDLHREDTR